LKPTQEDRAANGRTRIKGVTYRYFGVFDGHGGPQCSEFLRKKLHAALLNHIRQAPRPRRPGRDSDSFIALQTALVSAAMNDTFKRIDSEFIEAAKRGSWGDGSTALAVLLTGNSPDAMLLSIANAGDCRAVLCSAGKAIRLTEDHKPNSSDERARIESVGGSVINVMGIWRVGVSVTADSAKQTWLSVSRSFGDLQLKEPSAVVSSVPDVTHRVVSASDCFLVLACDGVWDVLSDQEVIDIVLRGTSCDPKSSAVDIVRTAHQRKSGDNLTCTVIMFPWAASVIRTASTALASQQAATSSATGAPALTASAAAASDELDDMFA
jgi:serine/threonine protein phosphatase PrpC